MPEKIKKKSKLLQKLSLLFLMGFFCFLFDFGFESDFFISVNAEEESEVDEEEVEETEDEIEKIEKRLKKAETEKQMAEKNKLRASSDLGETKNNISIIQGELSKTKKKIKEIETEIKKREEKINEKKMVIAEIMREVNQADFEIELMFLAKSSGLRDYFNTVDNFEALESELSNVIGELQKEKDDQNNKKKEQEKIYEMKKDQEETLEFEKNKKQTILNQKQRELNNKSVTVSQLEGKLSKLQSELSSLLGDGYDAKDIKDAAKFASKQTGVRKDFIMGMLVVESDLGRYTGGCTYKQSRMSDYRKGLFKKICKDLDYDYKKKKVSCPPSGYSGTGGAMGVAQFMSDTWTGYQSSIASKTGHNPPDPWSLTDGVMAMALKLAKVPGVTSHKRSAEKNAAKLYLSGTTSSTYDWYGEKVLYWADNYKKLL